MRQLFLFRVWLGSCLLVAVTAAWLVLRAPWLETDLLALLPPTEQDPVVEEALRGYADHLSRKWVVVVVHEDQAQAAAAGRLAFERLSASPLFTHIDGRIDESRERAFYDLYFPFRYGLLDPQARHWLAYDHQGPERLLRRSERALYSPVASGWSALLPRDPLLLMPQFWQSLPRPTGRFSPHQGFLTAQYEGRWHILLSATLRDAPFSPRVQRAVAELRGDLLEELEAAHAGVTLIETGLVRYADAGTRSAQGEISTIGLGSLIGVILLVLAVFKSVRPLFLSLLPIGIGLLFALTACLLVFGKVHLLTLGVGAGLIGICIDYSFHFFTEQATAEAPWTPADGLAHIFPGITLGMITSVLGYTGLLMTPFPGLQQMAVFSGAGLAAAYATVVCWFPILAAPEPQARNPLLLQLCGAYLSVWPWLRRHPVGILVLLIWAATALLFLRRIPVDDDIRSLQHPAPELKQQEDQLRALTGGFDGNRFFIVEGENVADTLHNEEQLLIRLRNAFADTPDVFVQGVSDFVPSPWLQRRNRMLLRDSLLGEDHALEVYLNRLEFEPEVAQTAKTELADDRVLTLDAWLASPASEALRHLWLGQTERGQASVVFLSGVSDIALLEHIEREFAAVSFVDKVRDTNNLFTRYRVLAGQWVIAGYLLIYLLLWFRYGLHRATLILTPPVLAALSVLLFFALSGKPLNLFGLLALLLVLGIGVDYALFFAETGRDRRGEATFMAICLSACTTILSFGLLALSQTPVLHLFGLTVWLGITVALVLSPVAGRKNAAAAAEPEPSTEPEENL
ncbi:MMPL family transporter [Acanthopleuribacter pedis]|uniref:Membrane transport protein MMPL domain-containing protein n=1 Tax=Acanthopleuribacter pedis TaxID=442870 RepID=A0A8J7U7I0_9BACT|nr:hypothetical protein [Acanthopleuribacter pedis]MBO1323024.1 hypothetical protein [Acanthopleuribacter pedis]